MEQDRPSFSGSELAFFFDEEDIAATAEEDIVAAATQRKTTPRSRCVFCVSQFRKKEVGTKVYKTSKKLKYWRYFSIQNHCICSIQTL
jgi:hypothetical protein